MKTIASAVVALGLFLPTVLLSQWQQTSGPFGGPAKTMIVSGTTILAGTSIGAFRSTDAGTTWSFSGPFATSVKAFCINGASVFAGTSRGVYRTTDNGLTWNVANTGLTNLDINTIAYGGGSLYVGTDDGIFRSTDNGGTWSASGAFSIPVASLAVVSNSVGATLIYAGCFSSNSSNALFLSTNAGSTWTKLINPITTYKYVDASRLAVADNKVYVLYNTGYNKSLFCIFYQSSPSVPLSAGPTNIYGLSLIPYSGSNPLDLYYSDQKSLFRYRASDSTWLSLGPMTWSPNCFITTSGSIFMGTNSNGVMKSSDDGHTWIEKNDGIFNSDVRSIAFAPKSSGGKNLIASTTLGYLGKQKTPVYCSTNEGNSWSVTGSLSTPIEATASLTDASGNTITLAATWQGIYRSTDAGLSWNETNPDFKYINGLAAIGKNIFTTAGSKVYRSIDYGSTWTDVSQGVVFNQIEGIGSGVPSPSSMSLFCLDHYALFRSRDYGITWAQIPTHSDHGAGMRVCGQALFLFDTRSGVRRSSDDGDTWKPVNNGLSSLAVTDLAVCGSQLFAATDSDGVFRSLDYGESWSALNTGLPTLRTSRLAGDSTSLFVGTVGAGALRYEGDLTPPASLVPTSPGLIVSGTPFWVEVKVGDPNPVKDLAYVSFHLSSDNPACEYVDSTAIYGPFMTKVSVQGLRIIPTSLYWKPDAQTVSISLQTTLYGTSGTGIVGKAQFRVPPGVTSERDLTFSLSDVKAMDLAGKSIVIAAGSLIAHVLVGGGEVWPGDCNNDGVVNAADVLPIGVYYGQTFGVQNKPGMLWQGYLREGWALDTTRKKLLADANGDGSINSADVLAIGLNYGKTHSPVVFGKAASPQMADGIIQIGTPEIRSGLGGSLLIPVTLNSTRPVYGAAFKVKYGLNGTTGAGMLKLLRIDTSNTVFEGGLMVNRTSEEEGVTEIGMSKVKGAGPSHGVALTLVFDAPLNSPLWVEVSNVSGNDEHGNAVNLAGSVFQSHAEAATGSSGIPTENALMQNFPNPFNPATTIRFQLSDASIVSVKMFDILGREVVTLINEERAAGSYTVRWDATGVPSGIYCCRLTARNQAGQMFIQTRRMTIVK